MFDTQFLWTNIRPNRNTGDFDLDHQTVTIPADSNEAFSNIQQSTSHFPRHPTNDAREHGNSQTENPPAPPYEPSPAHSPDYYTPAIQPATESIITGMDEDHENAHENEEVPRAADDDNNSERYWRAIDQLD
jgi:hypothetical protein